VASDWWSLSGAELIAEEVRAQFVSGAGASGRGVVCVQAGSGDIYIYIYIYGECYWGLYSCLCIFCGGGGRW
jgi:hypothetical protein